MSDLENKNQEAATKKRPYNLREKKEKNAAYRSLIRPELADNTIDISGYDEIILGFPIWWYVAPTIINTFLEAYDFAGKKIVLFATSGGSGFGNTVKELQPSAPNAQIVEGRLLNRASKTEITDWVNTL